MAKAPAYRLQVLYDMREKKKKEEEEAYAEKKRQVVVEQQKQDQMRQQLKDMVQLRHQRRTDYAERTRAGEFTVQQIQSNDRHIDRMKQQEAAFQVDIDRQGERVHQAERAAEEQLQKVVKATQDFKALEKHKEKWQKQVKREEMLKEEMNAEDIAQAQYFQKLLEELGEA